MIWFNKVLIADHFKVMNDKNHGSAYRYFIF